MTEWLNSNMIKSCIPHIMYKPYSPEWNRKRYLKEAIDSYFNDYVEVDVIYADLMDILHERSEGAYADFQRTTDLEAKLQKD